MRTTFNIPGLKTSLAMALLASSQLAFGEARIHAKPILSMPASLDDSASAEGAMPFGTSLVPELEEPEMPEPAAPIVHEAAIPAHLVIVGQSRGAMLDRCRPRMRSVKLIGHGASPDGRPAACRLLYFVGRQKFRERPAAQHEMVRTRFTEQRAWQPKVAYNAAIAGLPPLPTAFVPPPPAAPMARAIILSK